MCWSYKQYLYFKNSLHTCIGLFNGTIYSRILSFSIGFCRISPLKRVAINIYNPRQKGHFHNHFEAKCNKNLKLIVFLDISF